MQRSSKTARSTSNISRHTTKTQKPSQRKQIKRAVTPKPQQKRTITTQPLPKTSLKSTQSFISTPQSGNIVKTNQRFFANDLDRSNLKPLSNSITNIDQLDTLHRSGGVLNADELQSRTKAAAAAHRNKVEQETKAAKDGKLKASQVAANEQIEQQLDEISQSANIQPPPRHMTRHLHSPYFLPMWDPEFRSNKDLIGQFEASTRLKLEDMDLIGVSLASPDDGNLRRRVQQKNKVSLVILSSTDATFEYGTIAADLWLRQFAQHGESNQDGAIVVQPTLISISEGFLSGLFINSINRNITKKIDASLVPHAFSYHIKSLDGPVARARRFLDCRNRYVTNFFLVDERGLIRWKARTATVPTKDFMQTLFDVTNDLILETKFDEAD